MNTSIFTLITGASGGIGHNLAMLAAADGKNLVLVARSVDKLEEIAETIRKNIKQKLSLLMLTFRMNPV